MRGDKQVGLFDVIKNGYDKDDDLKDLEELMYDNSKEAGNKMSINDMIKSFELNESDKTSKEEEILGYFWAKGPLFVRELLDLQEESKPHYNTLSTIVRSLEEKGYIGYKVYGNTHQYYALVSEDEYRRNSLKQVISKYYDNSYTRVVSTLIEEEVLTIDELQKLIQQIKNK